jgi:glycosyltransferase involved in cell wall biosynthesis
MPSLLCVAPVDHPGGAEIGLLRLIPRLRERGWETTLTTPGPGPLRDAAEDLGIPWHPLPLGGINRGSGTRAVLSFGRARRLADPVDAVYLNGGVTGRLLPALRGTPAALHVHDLVDRVPGFWRNARLLLADSAAVATRLGPLAPRAQVVGCPIEREPKPVPPPWEPDGRPVIGYVGRIEPRKGVLDLVHAAPRLQAAGARVVVVGDDPYRSDPAYLAEVLAGDVEHYGWVSGAAGLMAELDVLVLPSRAEPFGTVLAEAMNAGTPVVATAGTGGLAEVVDDGVTGRLVAPGDVDALVDATLDVLAHKEEMGAAGRERAKRWHAGVYAERISDLLNAMLRVPVGSPS